MGDRSGAAIRLFGASLAAIAYAYANVPLGSGPFIRTHLDATLDSGLEFLDRSDHFRTNVLRGGQHPVEIWIASKILRHYSHPGFAEDLHEGWRSVMNDGTWRVYRDLLEDGSGQLPQQDEAALRSVFTTDSRWPFLRAGFYNSWFLFALHPQVSQLGDPYHQQFYGETLGVWYGYGLTHRIYAYRILEAKHPDHAARLGIQRRRERAEAALYLEMWLDIFLSDLYFARVAFYLEQPTAGPVNPRWIERIIRGQNEDGGWSWSRSPRCFVENAIGRRCVRQASHVHPSFLAVYALAQYRSYALDEDETLGEGLRDRKEVAPRQP
jgi:hypothetical protein